MKMIVPFFVAVMMVAGAVAQERCGCNKPRPTTPKQPVAAVVKQPAAKPAAQPAK